MAKIVWVHLKEIQNYLICNYLLSRKFFLKSKVNEKLVCRGGKKLNYMIICRTFNFEFSSYKLLSYRRRQIDLLWKGQRSVDVTKCQHYTTQFWRRKKKIKSQPLVYALLLYFIEELNWGHKEVDIGSLLANQTVFEYKCLRSVYSWGRRELGLLNSSFCYMWGGFQVRQKYFFCLFRWYFETSSVCEKNYKIFFSLSIITKVFFVYEVWNFYF